MSKTNPRPETSLLMDGEIEVSRSDVSEAVQAAMTDALSGADPVASLRWRLDELRQQTEYPL